MFKGAIGDRSVALAYMTDIFPIGRYDTQSALNNFDQISMLNTFRLGKFVGFTGEEVSSLCQNMVSILKMLSYGTMDTI